MNGTSDPNHNNQRLIVYSVLTLGLACVVGGTALTYKGYNAELLIGGGTAAIAGLLGVLSNRSATPPPDVTLSAGPPAKVELSQPKASLVQPTEPSVHNLI